MEEIVYHYPQKILNQNNTPKMKKLFFPICILLLTQLSGCQKNTDDPPPPPPPTKTAEELLVDKTWKFEYVTFVTDNKLFYYERNGSNNTANFGNDAIVFKKDGTGTYTATGTQVFTLTWKFEDTQKSKIKYTIKDYDLGVPKVGSNQVVIWENIVLTEGTLKYAEIYSRSDAKSIIASAKRVPL